MPAEVGLSWEKSGRREGQQGAQATRVSEFVSLGWQGDEGLCDTAMLCSSAFWQPLRRRDDTHEEESLGVSHEVYERQQDGWAFSLRP